MTNLSTKIKLYVGSEVDFNSDVLLQNDSDGKGDYIKEWNLDIAKPTQEQLDALETEANDYEQELKDAEATKENLKASAKAKLISGQPLTEEEANTIVL